MSLQGKASANEVLKGRISRCNTQVINAYHIAVKNGFEGTETEWLASLKGENGDPATVVTVTVSDNGDGTYTADKTYSELVAAKKEGKTLLCRYYDDDVYLPFTLYHGVFTFSVVVDCCIYQIDIGATGENQDIRINFTKKDLSTLSSGGGSSARIDNVTLLASAWVGTASPYSQVVQISGVTENSQVDLTPSVEQLSIFHDKDLAFVTENEDGVVTVYALGDKPTNDYTIQVTITEVYV